MLKLYTLSVDCLICYHFCELVTLLCLQLETAYITWFAPVGLMQKACVCYCTLYKCQIRHLKYISGATIDVIDKNDRNNTIMY